MITYAAGVAARIFMDHPAASPHDKLATIVLSDPARMVPISIRLASPRATTTVVIHAPASCWAAAKYRLKWRMAHPRLS